MDRAIEKSSRLPGFYKLSMEERVAVVGEWAGLDETEQALLLEQDLPAAQANHMVENAIGTFSLPMVGADVTADAKS